MNKLGIKDIERIFPVVMFQENSSLVLKKPKTQSSIGMVWLPKTVTSMLSANGRTIEPPIDGKSY